MVYLHLPGPKGWLSKLKIRISLTCALLIPMLITGFAANPVQAVKSQNTAAPYIVDDGVQMYEVNHAEAGGWPIRVQGDDTYGKGELLAVSVEFSESISVDSETTFRIQMGTATRGLVPVSTLNETVIFATLVRSYDSDSGGIWIGDNTATLDHNEADAIQSTGDSPRNADLSHPSLGTQSNHKVVGNAIRPKIRSVRIASTPEFGNCDDTLWAIRDWI